MLSLFPEILFLSPFAATIIRIALAALLAYGAWSTVSSPDVRVRVRAIFEIAVAVLLFAGAWTQAAALFAVLLLALSLAVPQMRTLPRSSVLLALAMAISLVVTGPGAIALDLPL